MPKKQVLEGLRMVFTGKMTLLRAEATQKATNLGAMVQGSVTGVTDVLVCAGGADHMYTSKYAKAIDKGLEIWSEKDFVRVLNGGPKPDKNNAKNKTNFKKKSHYDSDSSSSSCSSDTESTSSSESDYVVKKKKKKSSPTSSPKYKKQKQSDDLSRIMLYCGKGGCKIRIAEHFKYHNKLEKVINDTTNTARHLNLAPFDVVSPLNVVVEGNLDSPAWSVLHALGINPKYHDSAVMKPVCILLTVVPSYCCTFLLLYLLTVVPSYLYLGN